MDLVAGRGNPRMSTYCETGRVHSFRSANSCRGSHVRKHKLMNTLFYSLLKGKNPEKKADLTGAQKNSFERKIRHNPLLVLTKKNIKNALGKNKLFKILNTTQLFSRNLTK